MSWGGCKISSPSPPKAEKDFAVSWLKNARPVANISVSGEQFIFLNKMRTKMLEKGERKVPYRDVIQILIDNYNGEFS